MRDEIGLALERVIGRDDLERGLSAGGRVALLERVRQLVGEQVLTLGRLRPVGAA